MSPTELENINVIEYDFEHGTQVYTTEVNVGSFREYAELKDAEDIDIEVFSKSRQISSGIARTREMLVLNVTYDLGNSSKELDTVLEYEPNNDGSYWPVTAGMMSSEEQEELEQLVQDSLNP